MAEALTRYRGKCVKNTDLPGGETPSEPSLGDKTEMDMELCPEDAKFLHCVKCVNVTEF